MSKSDTMHHTNEELEARSKILFNSEWVSPELNQRNRDEWISSVKKLGNNWLYAKANLVKRKGAK